MKKVLTLLIVPLLFSLASCQVACTGPYLQMYFSGYDSTDLVLVRCSKYEKYNNFTTPILVTYGNSTRGGGNSLFPVSLDQNYDYLVEVLSAGRTYKITGITFGHGKTYNTNNGCTNAAKWYVNGTPYTSREVDGSSGGGNSVMLSK